MNEQEKEILTQFPKKRSNLIPILQKFQETEKSISPELISGLGEYLDISENDIYSVAGFYPHFRLAAPGEHSITVCLCMACRMKGGSEIFSALKKALGIESGQTTGDSKFSLDMVTLSGCSGENPVVMIDHARVADITPDKVKEIISQYN